MPTYKNVTLSLRSSAHGTAPLLEFPPPPHSPVKLEDGGKATASVYVLSTPKLDFWIAYHIKPPIPPEAKYFVFKLFMENRHVVTWCVGAEDDWKGTTMFGLYENKEWDSGIEKRAFAFGGDEEKEGGIDTAKDHESRFLEVRVLRCKARRRVQREIEELKTSEVGKKGAGGVDLANAGPLKQENPKRYYQFALIDSLKEPFATFRYYYRTWNQLEVLGVVPKEAEESDEKPVRGDTSHGYHDLSLISSLDSQPPMPPMPTQRRHLTSPVSEDIQPTIEKSVDALVAKNSKDPEANVSTPKNGTQETANLLKRLSFPPSSRFPPSQGSFDTRLPMKRPARTMEQATPKTQAETLAKTPAKSTESLTEVPTTRSTTASKTPAMDPALDGTEMGAVREQEWFRRTPSPVKNDGFRQYDSPAPGATRGRTTPTSKIRDVVKRALRRKKA